MKFVIDAEWAGLTVKKVLFDRLDFSRKAVTSLKTKEKGILVNGERKTVRCVLKAGDELSLDLRDGENSARVRPAPGPIDILYEDEHFLSVNKPPFMAVHPSKKLQDDTLAGRILYHRAPLVFRAAGRLDKNTSGAVICSKNKVVSDHFTRLILSHAIRKEYLAILEGKGELPPEGVIDLAIRRSRESYITRECFPADETTPPSERAKTEYRLLVKNGDHFLVLASPVTGRTHQLRAHFSALGFPILGDTLYGKASELIPRQALHALRLSFRHPETGEEMKIFAPLHGDFLEAVKTLFGTEGEKAVEALKFS